MEANARGAYRCFDINSIFSDTQDLPEHKIIWKSRPKVTNGIADPESEEMVQIAERGINIVASRDVRQNVRQSMKISLDLAADGQRVLYVNSYAGLSMLRDSLATEITRVKQERPDVDLQLADGSGAAVGEKSRKKSKRTNAKHNEEELTPFMRDYIETKWTEDFVPRKFSIVDCKMGMWSVCRSAIEKAFFKIRYDSVADSPLVRHVEKVPIQVVDVLVINSYEFSALSYRDKLAIATDVMSWIDQFKLTVIIFTQESRAGMDVGIPVRGPLGILTASAATLSRLDWVPKEKTAPVHEHFPNTNTVPDAENSSEEAVLEAVDGSALEIDGEVERGRDLKVTATGDSRAGERGSPPGVGTRKIYSKEGKLVEVENFEDKPITMWIRGDDGSRVPAPPGWRPKGTA